MLSFEFGYSIASPDFPVNSVVIPQKALATPLHSGTLHKSSNTKELKTQPISQVL